MEKSTFRVAVAENHFPKRNTPVSNLFRTTRARAHHSFQTHLTHPSISRPPPPHTPPQHSPPVTRSNTRHNGRPIRLRLAAAAAPPTRAMRHEIPALPVAPARATGRDATQDADGGAAVHIRLVDDRATSTGLADVVVASTGDGDELRERWIRLGRCGERAYG